MLFRQPGRSFTFALLIWVAAHLCGHTLCLQCLDEHGHDHHHGIHVEGTQQLDAEEGGSHESGAPCTCCCCRILCSDFRGFFSISTFAEFSQLISASERAVPLSEHDPLYHPPDAPLTVVS
jgi:hypothetical protein